jgi:MYXO-CTERM domain-containing protein
VDSGVPGRDAGTKRDAAVAVDAADEAGDTGGGDTGSSGGCGCRTAQPRGTPGAGWLAALGVAVLGAARWRRKRR